MPPRTANSASAVSPTSVAAARLVRVSLAGEGLVFATALLVRWLHFWQMHGSLVYQVLICDAWQYDAWAQRVAAGDWLGNEVFYQTPLYPYSLAVVYRLVGHHIWAIRILQALASSLACLALVRAGTHFFSRRAGVAAGLMAALYPPAIFFDGLLQKATLDLFLMSVLIWLCARMLAGRARWVPPAAGVTLGALILNRENALVLIPVVLAWFVWLARDRSKRAMLAAALGVMAGMALATVPVGLRNAYVGGEFLLTTSQLGPNFYIGNHQGADGRYQSLRNLRGDPRYERDDARMLAEHLAGRDLTPREVSQFWLHRAGDEIAADPAGWLRLLAYKAWLTLHRTEVVDAESPEYHARDSWVLRACSKVWHFGTLAPLAVVGVWVTRQQWRRIWVLHAMTLAFFAAVAAFYVFARYRYPLVPMAMLFAGTAVDVALQAWQARSGALLRQLIFGAIVAAPIALAANWPMPLAEQDRITTSVNVGTALLDLNRPAEALEELTRATQIDPNFAGTWHNMGLAAMALDDDAQGERYLKQALTLDPQLSVSHFQLGKLYHQRGDVDAARGHLNQAMALDPLMAEAHQLAGRIAMSDGDVEGGLAKLRRSAELNPRSATARADVAMALDACGRTAEAIEQFRAALAIDPQSLSVTNNLAWILATASESQLRLPREALALAERVCRATNHESPQLLDTLAAAQAANGDFAAAATTIQQAINLAEGKVGESEIAPLRARLRLYESDQPYVAPAGR